ncbi:DUF6691 family protein [Undibacterium sp. Dicai25W]|uniref:DUF6691 family protein n=1 Tax=Undibacterium sp. Dicai25W TaxID=3413034 RepID=UPI003BF37810
MTYFTSLFAGLLFGLGLIVSGMVNPGKVLGFLDLAGAWDPSLMLVMLGAIAVGLFAFAIAKKRVVSFIGEKMDLPTNTAIDLRLVGGSALFGIGWGLAGFCPGPALVGLSMGLPSALIFVAAMIAGMLLFEFIEKVRAPQ